MRPSISIGPLVVGMRCSLGDRTVEVSVSLIKAISRIPVSSFEGESVNSATAKCQQGLASH